MDLSVWIPVFSAFCSWTFCTVLSAPAADPVPETPAASADSPRRHVRTKRCSCATFMDKECVYFCHLDIIWVNTPERVVSYGLGNASRTRRALRDSVATVSWGPRCACVREDDRACRSFCGVRIRPRPPRAALKTRRLPEEWRARQRRRVRSWEGESSAS